jgi:oligo-1,6-glucosidase
MRTLEDSRLLVILNFFEREPMFEWPEGIAPDQLELLICNYDADSFRGASESKKLRPYEARVYKVNGKA